MNILITGGYGFIGSTVAERFHKEGHKIYIIDNMTTGKKEHLSVPHKAYEMDITDAECAEVFQSVGFDVVVHLAAQVDVVTSINQPSEDTRSNILGLVNILNCSARHGVKKVIFASSAAVYGNADNLPLKEGDLQETKSIYGMNKWLGEQYCAKWGQLYNLDTLCFRFSNVYGPKQGNGGEGGVVSIFMQAVRDGKPIVINGDGEQTRDFIFVNDVADAIYRGATGTVTGVMNLSTRQETSINELINIIGTFAKVNGPRYRESRTGDIARSCLDNSLVKQKLDWVPLYSVQEGLALTYDWIKQQGDRQPEKLKKQRKGWNLLGKARGYIENAVVFAGLCMFSLTETAIYSADSLDLFAIYILVMGLFYGSRQALPAAVAVIAISFIQDMASGRFWGSIITSPDFLVEIALYLFLGLTVGFVKDKYVKDIRTERNQLELEKQRYEFLMNVYKDTRSVKESLQKQVLTSKDSLGRLHTIVGELESLEPERVMMTAVKVMEDLVETRRLSIYAVSNDSPYLRLLANSSDPDFKVPRSIHLNDAPEIAKMLQSGKPYINRNLVPNAPMLAAPIMHNGQTNAVICIHEMPFSQFTLYHENLFKISVDLVSQSLSRSLTFINATRSDRYIEDTAVMQEHAFKEVIHGKRTAKSRNQTDYVLLAVSMGATALAEMAVTLSGALRSTDYIGILNGQLTILLSSTGADEAKLAMERMEKRGVRARVLQEDEVYA
ncbi:UDP-glucose 4-epimerase [compost metagenome]